MLFLEAVQAAGGMIDTHILARAWARRVDFPWDEYGAAHVNLRRGFMPPLTGWFDNPFAHCMGSPIRSELWAMLAPNRPDLAAFFALQDAMIDHGIEGIAGEMFFSAFESAAFSGKYSIPELIDIGLSYTPEHSLTRQAVAFTQKNASKFDWKTLREKILENFGHPNFTEAPQNIAFTIIGLLYFPDDFDQALLATVNCGYDTDCTAATIGAMWGLIYGDHFPQRWLKPIGNIMFASHGVTDLGVGKTIEKIAGQVEETGKLVISRYSKLKPPAVKKMIRDTMYNPCRMRLDRNDNIFVSYHKTPVLDKNGRQRLAVSGPVKKCFTRYPFRAKLTGKSIAVSVDPSAEFIPGRIDLTVETVKGRQYDIPLLAPHLLWSGNYSDIADLDKTASTAVSELAAAGKLTGYSLAGRTLFCRDLKGPVAHLCGYVHIGWFNKLRFCIFAEAPVTSFLNGKKIIETTEGRPCIPAPHRENTATYADADVQAGWHRWDIFLDITKPIREGKIVIALAYAYTKQLVDFHFQRGPGGVYNY
ncbi:MAG: hypothetical protein A2096_12385 [Spirochaetes bacterium GWF1_41_5]|nr:MAG: hypothetical protein A2096_12385 [Spirochaetes bacterium GWF1_41_5]